MQNNLNFVPNKVMQTCFGHFACHPPDTKTRAEAPQSSSNKRTGLPWSITFRVSIFRVRSTRENESSAWKFYHFCHLAGLGLFLVHFFRHRPHPYVDRDATRHWPTLLVWSWTHNEKRFIDTRAFNQ